MENIELIGRNLTRFERFDKEIPNNWNNYDFFLDYLNDNFKRYLSLLPSFEGYVQRRLFEKKDTAGCLCEKIIKTTADYLKGKTMTAYKDMNEAFTCISDILTKKSQNRYTTGAEFGFKARVISDSKTVPTREDMFHIPFEKRHLVQDNRYSIHGVPSVYLGRSIFDCYLELGKPELDNFWVSLFTFSQNAENVLEANQINLIDLTISHSNHKTSIIWEHVKKDEDGLKAKLDCFVDDILLWPLVMTCSVSCKYPNDAFQQEYIIPQIIYQFCSDYNEFVGIKYISTKYKNVSADIYLHALSNYALPAHDVRRAGYCPKLASQLALTEPVNIKQCLEVKIDTQNNISTNGFPILTNMNKSLKDDEILLLLDKMTLHFDSLLLSFMKEKNAEILKPLYGWKEE
ncbi:MAG: hypothetical protein VB081_10485 [Christensenella sp.]|uniref:hypothetical protein n=1 Tax=Christensenella sp. TaxID=1935934 RepID=UPI002B219369|nr:hypothetical protein [Christensenella sp.]MEA5003913.1 hypothetical protein [Christensenella sp.]